MGGIGGKAEYGQRAQNVMLSLEQGVGREEAGKGVGLLTRGLDCVWGGEVTPQRHGEEDLYILGEGSQWGQAGKTQRGKAQIHLRCVGGAPCQVWGQAITGWKDRGGGHQNSNPTAPIQGAFQPCHTPAHSWFSHRDQRCDYWIRTFVPSSRAGRFTLGNIRSES